MKVNKLSRRAKIRKRIRSKVSGTPTRPRLTVYRSNKGIYAQLIDDINGVTIAATNSLGLDIDNKTEQAKLVGKKLSELAKAKNIKNAVFDRNGYLYHGRVKALADGAREGGLEL